jgi:DNA-binding Xre family transcriptional regulator
LLEEGDNLKKVKFNLRRLVILWQIENNKDLSMYRLSKETGLREQTLRAYRDGTYKSIPAWHLEKLIEFFKCELSDLLKYEEE